MHMIHALPTSMSMGTNVQLHGMFDDLKISHVDEQVVRSIIQKIQDTFGQHSELSMHI